MSVPVPVVVHGAAGRLGQAILRAARERGDVRLAAALVRGGSELDGTPLSHVLGPGAPVLAYAGRLDAAPTGGVLIDVSGAAGFDAALALALENGLAFVSGSTGLDATRQAALRDAANTLPVLWTSNFSLGAAVLARLVGEAARALAGFDCADFDCEIVETHHRHKRDAPSGTALALGRAVASARGTTLDATAVYDRHGADAPRAPGSIGFAVVRGGDVVGEHAVRLLGDGESLELSHRVTDRAIFARGALAAAVWLAGRTPGFYAMDDVIAAPR